VDKKRVVLCMSPWRPNDFFTGKFAEDVGGAWHPLGILSIAGMLEREGHRVMVLDGAFISFEDMVRMIYNYRPHLLGVYSNAFSLPRVSALAKAVKEVLPEVKVVVGGPITVGFNEMVLKQSECIDVVVVGEGEETIVELVEGLDERGSWGEIKGISFRDDGQIVSTALRKPIADLDNLPYPARHLVPLHMYRPPTGTYKRLPAVYIFSSRGCNGECIFCWQMSKRHEIRYRSAENVLGEIDQIVRDFPFIREIRFFDDNFAYNNERAFQICEGIIRRGYDLTFYASMRVDNVSKELFRVMRRAGFWGVMLGLESMVQKDLDAIRKGVKVDQNREAVYMAKEAGIETVTPIIFGLPGQTYEDGLKTIEEVCKLPTDYVNFHALTPFPGTELFNNVEKYGKLTTDRFEDFTFEGVAFTPYTMTREEILKLRREGFKRFYSRPAYLMKRAVNMKTWVDARVAVYGLRGLFRTIFMPNAFDPSSYNVS